MTATFDVAATKALIADHVRTADRNGKEDQVGSLMMALCRDIERDGEAHWAPSVGQLKAWAGARGLLV